jgi:exodeoxyribonuclease VII small subunit
MEEKTFEEKMKELELIINNLEAGNTNLNESIDLFKNGTLLSKACHQFLEEAELEVIKLTQSKEKGH